MVIADIAQPSSGLKRRDVTSIWSRLCVRPGSHLHLKGKAVCGGGREAVTVTVTVKDMAAMR